MVDPKKYNLADDVEIEGYGYTEGYDSSPNNQIGTIVDINETKKGIEYIISVEGQQRLELRNEDEIIQRIDDIV